MLKFCGQDNCSIDANGRIKLSPRFISDFMESGGDSVVLHCLTEGGIAIYPETVFLEMREHEAEAAAKVANSLSFRRTMRRFGAMSRPEKISKQGRITVPAMFREYSNINTGSEICIIGVEIGIEIWNKERWLQEITTINEHSMQKGEQEMALDLAAQARTEF